MAFQYKITVFTPTYNRAKLIGKLYQSLLRQTFTDFEWVVVDDGSVDETKSIFDKWIEEKKISIRYHQQENGGKCRAINQGLKMAKGELFFTVDSDDYLTDDALEKIVIWEKSLPRDEKYCGVCGNLGTEPGTTPNKPLSGAYFDGTALDRYGVVEGERALVFYTEIHRKYLYPDHPGEKFMTEAITWNRMAHDGYKLRFYDDIIWIYEYKEDGLTQKGWQLFVDNPQGTGLFFRERAEFLKYPFINVLGMWYGFVCDAYPLCTNKQIAEYIGMPVWLVEPMKKVHRLSNVIRGKML